MYRKFMKSLTCVLAILFMTSTLAFAQGKKASGTVVAVVAEKVVTIRGADGKTYEVDFINVLEKNLKTGDMVEYELVAGGPINVIKPKKP